MEVTHSFDDEHTYIVGVRSYSNDDNWYLTYWNLRDMRLTDNTIEKLDFIQLFDNDELTTVLKSQTDHVHEPKMIGMVQNVFIKEVEFRVRLEDLRVRSVDKMTRLSIQQHIRNTYGDEELSQVLSMFFADTNPCIGRVESILRACDEDPKALASDTTKWYIDWPLYDTFNKITVRELRTLILRSLQSIRKTVVSTSADIKQGLRVLTERNELSSDVNDWDMDNIAKVGYNTARVFMPIMAKDIKEIVYDMKDMCWIDEHGTQYECDADFYPKANSNQDDFDFLLGRFIKPKGEL